MALKRRVLGLAGLLLCMLTGAATALDKPNNAELTTSPLQVTARPLASFDKSKPALTTFGKLEWRGGLVLTADSSHFGGWSGLAIDADGKRFVSVSDAGAWMTGELVYDGQKPKGIRNATIGPLQTLAQKSLKKNRDRDAEGVTLLDGTLSKGTLLIAFEANHRIGRFNIDGNGVSAPVGYLKMPADAKRMKRGNGLEAMAVLKGGPLKGSVVAFSERLIDTGGHHTGWIWIGGEPKRLAMTDVGFDPTAAAGLEDGSLLVLERRFRWLEGVKMRLRRLSPNELKPGAVAQGETLLEADMGQEIDNMEGLAVHRGPAGETVLSIISDDNFNHMLQRTLLLQFTMKAPPATAAGAR